MKAEYTFRVHLRLLIIVARYGEKRTLFRD